jgi:hypothetical protein
MKLPYWLGRYSLADFLIKADDTRPLTGWSVLGA